MQFRTVSSVLAATILLALVSGPAFAQTPTVLYNFDETNGQEPYGSLTLSGSTLYGMTTYGGSNNKGTIFSISTSGVTPTILFKFDGTHGAWPQGSLTLSGAYLYGMTFTGGNLGLNDGYGYGTIFRVPITGGTPTVLFNFDGTNFAGPNGSLTLSGSTMYGMTTYGGSNGYGTIFSMPISGGTPTILFSFDGPHGENPYGDLTLSGSTLYGMTSAGGTCSYGNYGTIFSIPTSGGTPTTLFSFDGRRGLLPEGSLTLGGSTLYGMANQGGDHSLGTIFSIPTSGGTPTVLFSFDGTHGEHPYGSLTLSGTTLYGMTQWGGDLSLYNGWGYGDGTIFSISTSGGTPTVRFIFEGLQGANPQGNLTISGTKLFGMAMRGGANGVGTIFSVSLPGCTLTTSARPTAGGTVTFTPSQPFYSSGDVVTITASPATAQHYSFVSWSATGGTVANATSSTTSLTITGNCTITASFTICSLITYAKPSGAGQVTVTPNQSWYNYGDVVAIQANPSQNYGFVSWSVSGGSVANTTASSTSLTITGPCTLTASFMTCPLNFTAGLSGGGTVTVSPNLTSYAPGSVVSILAQPMNQSFGFVSWSVSGGGSITNITSSSTSLTITNTCSLAAIFTTCAVTTSLCPPAGGTVQASPSYTYNGKLSYPPGTVVTFTETAKPYYGFVSWSVSGGGSVANATSSITSLTVTGNCTLTASFTTCTLTTQDNPYSIYYRPTYTPNQTSYAPSSVVTVQAVPPGQYYGFVSWSVTGGTVANVTSSSTSLTITGNCTLVGNFATCYVTTTVSPSGQGNIWPPISTWQCTPGGVATIQEWPNAGCGFVGWVVSGSGSVASATSTTTTLTVTGNCTVTASFTEVPYTVAIVSSLGTVNMTPSQATYYFGDTVALAAASNSGWTFSYWSLTDSSGNDLTVTCIDNWISPNANLTMPAYNLSMPTENLTLTAYYALGFTGWVQATGFTVSLSDSGPYSPGQVITATASPQPGFVFAGWSVQGASTLSDSTAATTSLTVNANFILTADYELLPGEVYAWGENTYGQLGDNTTTQSNAPVPVVDFSGSGLLTNVVAVAGGDLHTVALKSDGTVWTWGDNSDGQLGDNTTTQRNAPVQVVGTGGSGFLTGVVAEAAGDERTVALKSDGTVWTWGDNWCGALGDNTTTVRHAPVQVVGPGGSGVLTGVVAIAAGSYHMTLALKSDGTVWTWGDNQCGELGDNTTTERHAPVQVVGPGGSGVLTGVVALSAGFYHTVALKSDGTVWAWGYNSNGQLGDNTTTQRKAPVQVVGTGGSGVLTGMVAVAAGEDHSVALKSDGTVWAWGYNNNGQIGDNTTNERNAPVQVLSPSGSGYLTNIVAVAAGLLNSVALKSDGTVWAWGYNNYGQIGDNTTTQRTTPVQVDGIWNNGYLTGIGTIAAGEFHTVALSAPLPLTLAAQVTPPGAGTVAVTPSQATYFYGDTVTFSQTTNPGYTFAGWAWTGGTISGSTLTVCGNATLTALYTQNCYSGSESGLCGSIILSDSGPYTFGEVITVTASANPFYVFDGWNVTGASELGDWTAATTSLTVYDNFTLTAEFLAPTMTASVTLDNTWVYQNTAATTQDRKYRTLTITVPQDSWPDQTFTVVVSQSGSGVVVPSLTFVDSTGSGAVTPTSSFTFTSSSATLYLVGGRQQADGVTGTGVCTITIQVTGDVSQAANAATAQVVLAVRPLGDITGDGAATTADRVQLMMRLNSLPTPDQTDADFDLDGDGVVTANDLAVLNALLNNLPVP